jgi:hypothetical protein
MPLDLIIISSNIRFLTNVHNKIKAGKETQFSGFLKETFEAKEEADPWYHLLKGSSYCNNTTPFQ